MTSPADDNLWLTALDHYRAGRLAECESACRQIAADSPHVANALHLLGVVCFKQNRLADSISALRRSAAIDPRQIEVWTRLAYALASTGQPEEAIACYQQALQIDPNHLESLNNLGSLHVELMQYDQARIVLERLLELHPRISPAHNNLGSLHLMCGRLEQAISHHRRAVELNPSFAEAHSNLLHDLLYSDVLSPRQVFAEHLEWARRHATPNAGSPRPATHKPTDPDRPLRMGYLSPDLRNHPVAAFLEPVLAHHDRGQFIVTCYQDSPLSDAVTARLRQNSQHWCEIYNLPDDQLEKRIAEDRIDILIDLAVHSGRNRLPLFARKPAPILMTYLGYAFTTGIGAVDYRITDAVVDPPGMTESIHTERLLRLPEIFWCFRAPAASPPIAPLPALANGYITFGSANRLAKITPTTLTWWARILKQAPISGLRLIAPELRTESVRTEILWRLQQADIDPARVSLVGSLPLENYLAALGGFDIALDTFPFTGGSTTCHTLWMGVPVVTRAGPTPISRVSASVLSCIEQRDLIASTDEEFVTIASNLASDIPGLAARRRQMRTRMQESPLMREATFVRNLEAAYRHAWRTACAAASSDQPPPSI